MRPRVFFLIFAEQVAQRTSVYYYYQQEIGIEGWFGTVHNARADMRGGSAGNPNLSMYCVSACCAILLRGKGVGFAAHRERRGYAWLPQSLASHTRRQNEGMPFSIFHIKHTRTA